MSKLDISSLKFKPFSYRLGDIKATNYWVNDKGRKEPAQSHLTKKYSFFEILKCEKNPYYDKENEYIFDEWNDFYYKEGNLHSRIDKSCFKNPETCYMLAHFVDLDNDEILPNLEFTFNRPFELTEEEQIQFLKVGNECYKNIVDQITKWKYKDNE